MSTRICILETGIPPAEMADIFPHYPTLFEALIEPWLPGARFGSSRALEGRLPADVADWDAYVITGSPATAFDREPWMLALEGFTRAADAAGRKVVGICFGHQLAAQAFGGTVERRGWGLGVRGAKAMHARATRNGLVDRDAYDAIVSHQDQVTVLPDRAEVLATSVFCPYEMLAIGPNVLTLQGHPEMNLQIAEALVHRRRDQLDAAAYDRFLASLATTPHNADMGRWIARFIAG
jgi:GMP synthase-like glutamine amidotransferase